MNCGSCGSMRQPTARRPMAKCDWFGQWLSCTDGQWQRCGKCLSEEERVNPFPEKLPELLRPQAI